MQQKAIITFLACLCVLGFPGLSMGDHDHDHTDHSGEYYFIENKGQWDERAVFMSELPGGNLFLEKNAFTYDFYDNEDIHDRFFHDAWQDENFSVDAHAFQVRFIGSNPNVELIPSDPFPGILNYMKGNDPSKWASNVRKYHHLQYKDLYPGIDLKIYTYDGSLKYDFIVHPGADPSQIRMEYGGVDKLKLKEGSLIIKTSVNEITENQPLSYQADANGLNTIVPSQFNLEKRQLSFEFPSGYDDSKTLTIDPTLIFSTYSGSFSDNWGYTATYDSEGNLFAGGIVRGSSYPVTLGAYQTSWGGGLHDISITKFSSDGTTNIYSTYLGGSNWDQPYSLIVNSFDELLILGSTNSNDFPMTTGYDITPNGDYDIVVCRLSQDGTSLLGSTYMGGTGIDGVNIQTGFAGAANSLLRNYGDNNRGEIMVDDNNSVYIASCTQSNDFPATPGSFQSSLDAMQDGCVFKLSPDLSTLNWATYLGGNNDDACYSLAVDGNGAVFVTGGTASSDFPTSPGAHDQSYGGNIDGYIFHLSDSGSTMLESTLIGTGNYDQCYFIQIDEDEDAYVVGQTNSPSFPITPGVYANPGSGQFIAKYSNDLSSRVFSTVFGSGTSKPNISPTAFLVDVCEYIYVSGWGGNTNFSINNGNTNGMPTTADAYDDVTDGSDLYLIVLENDANSLVYGSYFGGGSTREHVDGGTSRFDKKAVVYQAVCAGCGGSSAFPTTPGVVSTTNNSSNCNLGAFKLEFPLPGIFADFEMDPDSAQCAPMTVNFLNTSDGGSSYVWDYGDGSGATTVNGVHTYSSPGSYTVMLVAIDPLSCNKFDTAYQTVEVLPQPNIVVPPDTIVCPGQTITLTATGGTPGESYQWFPPGLVSSPTSGTTSANPTGTTTYSVEVTSTAGCKDTAEVTITLFPEPPDAIATGDTAICPGDTVQIIGTAGGPGTLGWSPGGSLSDPSLTNPFAFPSSTTDYVFTLTDSNGCKDRDTVRVEVSTVSANAGPDQDLCIGNTTSLSGSGGTSLVWDPPFALSSTSSPSPTANPDTTVTYILTVTDAIGCVDVDEITITVHPLPLVSAGNDTSICLNDAGTLIATGATSYSWFPPTGLSAPSSGTTSASPTSSTAYIVTGTDMFGCQNTDTIIVDVLELPNAVATPPFNTICEDSIVTLTATGGVGYSWFPPGGLTSPGSGVTDASPAETTDYIVTVTGSNGCFARDTVTINVIPTPVITVSADDTICLGELAKLWVDGAQSYLWSNGFTGTNQNVFPDSTTAYSVIGFENGCPSKPENILVTVIDDFPVADFVADPDSDWIPLDVQFSNLTTGGTNYIWDFGNGSGSIEFEPTYLYTDSGSFQVMLVAINEYGCRDTATNRIIVLGGFNLFVPNAFTPNDDDVNDEFLIEDIGLEDFEVMIYDRWGNMIFHDTRPDFRWKGDFRGKPVPEGVYTWVIKAKGYLKGKRAHAAGTVTVIR